MAEIRVRDGIARGTVAFGMPPSVSMVMSVPVAKTVRVEHPLVRLQAIEAMSGIIKTRIENRTVDIGFLYRLDRKANFHAVHVLGEELCFFPRPMPDHSTAHRGRLCPWRGWQGWT